MGIAIDIMVVLFLLWSLVRGWRMGFLYQLGIFAFLAVAYFASRGLALLLEKPVAKFLGCSPFVAGLAAFAVVFIVLGIIGVILVRKMTKELIPDRSSLSGINRFLGAIVSLAKGALIAYVAIVLLLQIQRIAGKTPFPKQSSVAATFVDAHNFLNQGEMRALTKLIWLASTRDLNTLAKDPRAQKLMQHPKAKGLYTPEIFAALQNQDYVTLVQNDALWDYLAEPEVQATLDQFEWVEASKAP